MRPMLLLFITAAILHVLPAAALAAPRITFNQPDYNAGVIPQGKKVEHVFTFRNSGDAPLTVTQTKTSCGCTAAVVSARTIPPGKGGEIKAVFDSANFSGSVSKTVYVYTNDPATPVYTLTLRGTVVEQVQINPRQLNLGAIKPGTKREMNVTVENRGEKPLSITAVRSPMKQVTTRIGKNTLRPGESTVIRITVTPREEDRLLSGYISILTDNPAKPETTVPVYGTITR